MKFMPYTQDRSYVMETRLKNVICFAKDPETQLDDTKLEARALKHVVCRRVLDDKLSNV